MICIIYQQLLTLLGKGKVNFCSVSIVYEFMDDYQIRIEKIHTVDQA